MEMVDTIYAGETEITGDTFRNLERGTFAGKTVGDLIASLIPYFFYAAGVLLLFYMITGGYSILVSQGDPKKIQQGKQVITNALTGFLMVFLAYWIVQLIALLLGIESITTIFS